MQNNFNTNPKYKNKKNMTPPPIKTTDLSNDFDDLNVLQSDSLNCNSIAIKQSTRLSSNSNSNLSYSSVSSVNSSNLTSSSGSSVIIGEDFTVGSRISTNCSGSSPQAFNRRSREDHNQNISYNGNGARRHSNPSNVYTYNNRNNNHKERYVFSKFLIKEDSIFPKSVDEPFDWLAIEMVLVPEIENVLCPICLDVPCVARFTRCGHIYCLPCLLQFFQSSTSPITLGNNWRTCPVCAEPLHLKQLRPVKFCPATEPKEGEIFHSILIQKSVNSLQPNLPEFANDTLSSLSPFQRLIPVTNKFVLDQIIGPELNFLRTELRKRKSFGENSLEMSFYEAAISLLENHKKFEVYSDSDNCRSKIKESSHISTGSNARNLAQTTSEYYFHQSRDGLNVFLHPICMKILKTQFKTFPDIPTELSLPILQLERVIVNANNRKRFKYLDHLSSGTQIILAEVDLTSIVSLSILNSHQKELSVRRNARHQKLISEHRSNRRDDSILEEWKRMEDDYYSTSTTAMDIKVPETVNLDNLNDEASFPLPSSFNSNNSNSPQILNSFNANKTNKAINTSNTVPLPIIRKLFNRSSTIATSNSFVDTAISPPSYSALAHSLNSPFIYNSNLSPDSSTITTTHTPVTATADNNSLNSCNISGSSPCTNSSQGSKKKFVLFSNGLMNFKR